jgi:tRNA-dihydrouridine synthase
MKRYLRDSVAYLGERQACLMMRSRLGWFVKGLHGSSQFRKTITLVSTMEDALAAIEGYERMLAEQRASFLRQGRYPSGNTTL